jgi:LacI family transcriptional regulator
LEGYRRALLQAGLTIREDYIINESKGDVQTRRRGADAMRELLNCRPAPDGVFCFNDPLAIGAMNRLLDEGLRIPEDVAVIGCGNLHYDDSLRVPLSSVDQRIPQIAQEAARITLRILASKVVRKPQSIVLEPQLVVRASTQRTVAKRSPSADSVTMNTPVGEMRF